MHNCIHVITQCNDNSELLHVSISVLLPQ